MTLTPAVFEPGATVTASVSIEALNGAIGGFYLSGSTGKFSLLEGQSTSLQSDSEVTHSAPKAATGSKVVFQTLWTAPSSPGGVIFEVWALSANGNNAPSGDGGGSVSLNVPFGCPGTPYYIDLDGDGYAGTEATVFSSCAEQSGFASLRGDCDDDERNVYPNAPERCNRLDDNCNGQVDEGLEVGSVTLYADSDGDGYGNSKAPTQNGQGCMAVPGYAPVAGDCNDRDPAIHPKQADICNLIDEDCNGQVDDASLLTGFWNKQNNSGGPSIDQLIGEQLVQKGFAAPLLNLGAKNGGYATSWKKAGQMNTPITDPYRVFNSLFAGAPAMAGGAGGGAGGSAAAAALKARRASVLDFVAGELQAFSSKLGTDDKAKIESHLESINTLEKKLTDPAGGATPPAGGGATVGAGCAQPKLLDGHPSLNDIGHYPDLVGSMMAIAGAAVKCDYARCVTVDLVDDGGGNALTYPWLQIPSPDYHAIAHLGKSGYPQKTKIDQWFYGKVAELVKDLESTPEGNGTVLDNTCILISNDMMEGASHDVHSIPYLIIGGCGGFFKTGQTVSFPKSVPNNQLLTTICHAMGLQVPSVGNSAYGGDIDSLLKA